ncbi:MAG: hypothetical protein R2838_23925 [Caldilineaceae bacterium]
MTSILQALQLVEGHDPRAASLFLLQAEILFACYEVDAAESAARAALSKLQRRWANRRQFA